MFRAKFCFLFFWLPENQRTFEENYWQAILQLGPSSCSDNASQRWFVKLNGRTMPRDNCSVLTRIRQQVWTRLHDHNNNCSIEIFQKQGSELCCRTCDGKVCGNDRHVNNSAENKLNFVVEAVCCNLSLTSLRFSSQQWKSPKLLASDCKQLTD